jgi:hypothetical protein
MRYRLTASVRLKWPYLLAAPFVKPLVLARMRRYVVEPLKAAAESNSTDYDGMRPWATRNGRTRSGNARWTGNALRRNSDAARFVSADRAESRSRWRIVGVVLVATGLGGWLIVARFTAAGVRSESARLATLLGIREGSHVADVGAGNGKYAIELARLVGPPGHVFATETDRFIPSDSARSRLATSRISGRTFRDVVSGSVRERQRGDRRPHPFRNDVRREGCDCRSADPPRVSTPLVIQGRTLSDRHLRPRGSCRRPDNLTVQVGSHLGVRHARKDGEVIGHALDRVDVRLEEREVLHEDPVDRVRAVD